MTKRLVVMIEATPRLAEAPAEAGERAAREAEDELGAFAERTAVLVLVLVVLRGGGRWRRRLVVNEAMPALDATARSASRFVFVGVELHVEATGAERDGGVQHAWLTGEHALDEPGLPLVAQADRRRGQVLVACLQRSTGALDERLDLFESHGRWARSAGTASGVRVHPDRRAPG